MSLMTSDAFTRLVCARENQESHVEEKITHLHIPFGCSARSSPKECTSVQVRRKCSCKRLILTSQRCLSLFQFRSSNEPRDFVQNGVSLKKCRRRRLYTKTDTFPYATHFETVAMSLTFSVPIILYTARLCLQNALSR